MTVGVGGVRGGILELAPNFPPGFAFGLVMGWRLVGALVLGGITYVSSGTFRGSIPAASIRSVPKQVQEYARLR